MAVQVGGSGGRPMRAGGIFTGGTRRASASLTSSPFGNTTLFGARCGPASTSDSDQNADQTRVAGVFSSTSVLGCERLYNGVGSFPAFSAPARTVGLTVILSVQTSAATTISGGNDSSFISLANDLVSTYPDVLWMLIPNVQEAPQNGLTQAQSLGTVSHVKSLYGSSYPSIKLGQNFTSFELQGSGGLATYEAWVNPSVSDFASVDCYANYGINNVNTLQRALQYGITFAADLGLPLVVPEMSFGGGTGHGGEGYTDAQVTSMYEASIPMLIDSGCFAAAQFESNKADGDWDIEPLIAGHATATAAWKAAVDNCVSEYTSAPWTMAS